MSSGDEIRGRGFRLRNFSMSCIIPFMKFAIDTFACDGGKSGFGSYLLNLTANLPLLEGAEYMLFGAPLDRYTYSNDIPFADVRCGESMNAMRFWHNFYAPGFYKRKKVSAVLYPAAARLLPSRFEVPGAAVLHDSLSALLAKAKFAHRMTLRGFERVQKIIVPTNFIKNDLLRLGFDGKKIQVVRHGIDHNRFYQRPLEDEALTNLRPFAIKRPYMIYPSSVSGEGKKHIELIKAFEIFKKRTGAPHRLVLAGAEKAWTEQVRAAALASSVSSDIFITGFFPSEGFPILLSGADACVFPSTQEGVGLPVVEAMASGVPVAAAAAGALPEICAGKAALFDSDNLEEMACAMEKVLFDQKARQNMISEGLLWSKKFDWENCAKETVEILKG